MPSGNAEERHSPARPELSRAGYRTGGTIRLRFTPALLSRIDPPSTRSGWGVAKPVKQEPQSSGGSSLGRTWKIAPQPRQV
jgi:hypothetical protein